MSCSRKWKKPRNKEATYLLSKFFSLSHECNSYSSNTKSGNVNKANAGKQIEEQELQVVEESKNMEDDSHPLLEISFSSTASTTSDNEKEVEEAQNETENENETDEFAELSDSEWSKQFDTTDLPDEDWAPPLDPYPSVNEPCYVHEFETLNTKTVRHDRYYHVKRHKKKSKKIKVNPTRYVNAFTHKREEEKKEVLSYENEKRKQKARIGVTFVDPGWDRRCNPETQAQSRYEKDIETAISRSRNQRHESGLTYAQLLEILNRDITPEDYDLLLALDSSVAPKTVSKKTIENFKESTATDKETKDTCAVCMCLYEIRDTLTHLPCNHTFHKSCITTWLKDHSQNCPLCNIKVV